MATAPLIFVVDDTEAARRATVLVLEKAGFRVAEAADGAAALRCIPELSPDLVLLDAVMPGMGGIEVLRRLRAEPRFALLPVVMLSSQLTQAKDQAEGLDAGADGYIARPISNVELVARVRALLRNQELSQQLRESEARFRELITQQVDGLLVVDAAGCIQFANPAAARIFGRKSEELVGHPFGFPISSGAPVEIDVPGAEAPGRILEFNASSSRWDEQPAHLISLRDVTEQRLAERNLRESEKRLSGIFQQSAAGMFLASLDGRYLRVNQRFCEIMGCTEAEILSRNSTETTHPDDRPLETSMTATMREGGFSSPSWDKRYLRQDGSAIWTNLTLSLVRDEEGEPQQYVGVVIDITQRKVADELVRTRARQQETVARIGFEATRTTTLQGIFDFATGAVAEALGVELCKVLQLAPDGSHLRLVSGLGWQPGLIGVGTVGVDRASQAGFTLNSDGAIYVNDFTQEARFTESPLMRQHGVMSGLSVKIMLRDKPWGVLGAHCRTVRTFNDVDADFMQAVSTLLSVVIERLAVQRTLTESEARMRDAQRIAHLGNWELDMAKNELIWSEEVFRIFGVEPSAFAATYEGFLALVHPDDREALQAAQQAVLSGQGRLDFEHRIIRPDGSIRHVQERGELIHDANGQPVALSGTVMDITDLRAAQSQAERMNALLTEAQRIADMGSWEMDLFSGTLVWSEETCRLFGIRPEEFGGTFETFTGFILPEDQAAYNAVHAGITPEAPLLESEYRIRRPDGEVRWMFERGRVTFDAAGKVIRRLGVVMDVTERKRAETELRESGELLQIAGRIARMGAWSVDFPEVRITWSDEVCAIHDMPAGTVPALDRALAYYTPESRPIIESAFSLCARDGTPFDVEIELLSAKRQRRWVRSIGQAERDQTGAIRRVSGAFQDITERKLAERAVTISEASLARAQRVARMGNWDWNIVTGELYWSVQVFELFGIDPTNAPGTYDRFIDGVHPEDREKTHQAVMAAVEGRAPYDVEHRVLRPDGTVRVMHEQGEVTRDAAGRPLNMFGTVQDITERKAAMAALRVSEERFRLLAKATNDAIWDWNLTTNELWWNEGYETLFGYARADVDPTIRSWTDHIHPEDLARVTEDVHSVIDLGGEAWSGEYRFRCQDGRNAYVLDRGHVIRDATGKPVRMIGGMTDLTKQKEHEIALSQSNRALQLLSRCNEALIRAETESGLLAAICQIAVDIGGFRTAWVGYAIEDADKSIVRQSHAGVEEGYLSILRVTWAEDDPLGQGPAGRVIRQGEPLVIPDLETDEGFRPWMELARAHGIRGIIMLPLVDKKRTFGVLSLHLAERRQPLPDEMRLLQELADDMAFGIVTIRARSDRQRMHTAVAQVAAAVSAVTSTDFFDQLTRSMVTALGAKAGFLAKVLPGEPVTSRTIAVVVDDQVTANFDYVLRGTPCENFFTADTCVIQEKAARQFPLSPTLAALGAEGFVGRRLDNAAGTFIGQLFVIFHEPLKDSDFVVSTLRIFAARAAAELERQETDTRLREQGTLLDKAQDAILVRDLEHRILYWNRSAERLYGWTAAEAVGRSVRELLYQNHASFDEAVKDALARGEWVGEFEQYTKAGEKILVEGHWTLVRDDRGNPKSILAIDTDITQRKKLEQQFLRAQRMESIGTLAGGIAHDLNNLLAPITMGVDLLRVLNPSPQSLTVIENIQRSAKRGADLVKQVLSFARGVEGERVALRVHHIVQEVESIMQNTFPKNISVRTQLPKDLWLVTADPTQLNQVLLNLCVNARDAMPDGGRLELQADNLSVDDQYAAMNRGAAPGHYVRIQVTDNGSGMSKEVIDRIFDPFFTTKELGKGTGLGLSTALGIVRSHGGFVNVYSEVGKGSTFKVYLPAQLDAAASKHLSDEVGQMPRGNGELILVVDDEASIVSITQQTLQTFGYKVLTAEDGAMAIGLYAHRSAEVALVLTDMMMPVMDGPALIAALRRIDPQVRIIAASGLNANGNVARAANAGVKHFLPKPYSADTMLRLIKTVLGEARPRAPMP